MQESVQPSRNKTRAAVSAAPPGATRLVRAVAALIIPAFVLLISALYLHDINQAFDPPGLVTLTNLFFITLASLVVAYLAARSYLSGGMPGLLFAYAAVLLFGLTSFISAWWTPRPGATNIAVTIYNTGGLLAGVLHFTAAALTWGGLAATEQEPARRRRLYAGLFLTLVLVAGLSIATAAGLTPQFFVQGVGPTFIRQMVQGASIVLFELAAILFLDVYRRSRSPFIFWFSLGLAMIGLGLLGVSLTRTVGSPMTWAGRIGQYIGCLYFLMAVWTLFHSARSRGIPIELAMAGFFQGAERYYRELVETSADAIVAVDQDGHVLMWNSAAERLLGYSRFEATGRAFEELVRARGSPESFAAILDQARGSGSSRYAEPAREAMLAAKDGQDIPAEYSLSARRAVNGWIVTYIIRDITERRRAEEAIRQSEARSAAMFQSLPFATFVFEKRGSDFVVAEYNRSAVTLTRGGIARLAGKTASEIYANRPDIVDKIKAAFEAKGVLGYSTPYHLITTGEDKFITITFAYVPPDRVMEHIEDITERKRLEDELKAERQLLDDLIDSTPAVVFARDLDGKLLLLNTALARTINLSKEQALGTTDYDVFPKEKADAFSEMNRKVIASGTPQQNEEVIFQDGEPHTFISNKFPLRDARGEIYGIAGVNTDITELKRAEAEREELLRREQEARAAADEARAQAEAAVKVRDHFISVASHELRTPLTSIKGYAELLVHRGREVQIDESFQRMARTINTQAGRLEKMVGMLLDISRIERGQLGLEKQNVDLEKLIHTIVAEIRPTLRRHSIAFNCDETGLVVDGDEARLEQVFQNLIQNAVKYSPKGGAVTIRMWRDEHAAKVAVSDRGIGIPPDELPRLFTRFHRARNAEAMHINGLGVGLYVVREIVRLHGGDIAVASEENHGSTFTISLPLADS